MTTLGRVLVTAKSVAGSAAALQWLRDAGCDVVIQNSLSPLTEAGQIIVGVEDDRRNAEQSRFLDYSAQQHGLAGACSREDRNVAR